MHTEERGQGATTEPATTGFSSRNDPALKNEAGKENLISAIFGTDTIAEDSVSLTAAADTLAAPYLQRVEERTKYSVANLIALQEWVRKQAPSRHRAIRSRDFGFVYPVRNKSVPEDGAGKGNRSRLASEYD